MRRFQFTIDLKSQQCNITMETNHSRRSQTVMDAVRRMQSRSQTILGMRPCSATKNYPIALG